MNDLFGGFKDFEELFHFLKNHFLPRVEWAKLMLSFKKLKLFEESLVALGVVHTVEECLYILPERLRKIATWPIPKSPSAVRGFLGTVGITRRWVRNFTEIARPLSRLTEKVEWHWEEAEQ